MLNYKKHGIKFIDEQHYKRFCHLHAEATSLLNMEYSSCLYILSSSKYIFEKVKLYVTNDGIKVNNIIKNSYSTSEEYLAKIAVAMFNRISSLKLDFYWVVKLDPNQYEIVIEAFNIRRGRFDKN